MSSEYVVPLGFSASVLRATIRDFVLELCEKDEVAYVARFLTDDMLLILALQVLPDV